MIGIYNLTMIDILSLFVYYLSSLTRGIIRRSPVGHMFNSNREETIIMIIFKILEKTSERLGEFIMT